MTRERYIEYGACAARSVRGYCLRREKQVRKLDILSAVG